MRAHTHIYIYIHIYIYSSTFFHLHIYFYFNSNPIFHRNNMAEICFAGDGEPSPRPKSRPRNSARRTKEFLHHNAAADESASSSSSPSTPPSHQGRKRRGVHHSLRRCKKVDNNVDGVETAKYGVTSVCGRRREMEDTVSLHPCFATYRNQPQIPLHFFGVFDGHGCSHVSVRCENRMHELLKEEIESELGESMEWKTLMQRSFGRMDEEVKEFCHHDEDDGDEDEDEDEDDRNKNTVSCRCKLQTPRQYDTVGSTALVAIVTPHQLIISNCGDSRAVLCRKTSVLPLSSDHKPDRPDELSRIESRGGRVIYWDGARVLGVLAMSRAIGDGYLKPYVISEPEVVEVDRTGEDEFLILATDGLWDVVSNETACDVVRTCMRAPPASTSSLSGSDKTCSDASIVLTKLAMAKHSSDNISVVVIDLRRDVTEL
ncbi:probable protein phosphatase 2C 24 isoform X1 [Cucurbita pepo subsp. pepo]|uniref:probable protein phosphatase 2C 24 isoform X1 n=1 Tax=Cucurbita pepo subsp. pepo TaxID=3664 RepID=UPI000C9D4D21|nr:probable protein phosphatase 2C 24 isoform X1 [Cucurbita pepo subsp. pepo]